MPQIQGRLMHGVQKHASDSRQIYARGAETCLRFRVGLCTGGRNMPQIQGRFMHGMQKYASDSGHINDNPKWSVQNLGHDYALRLKV